MKKVMIDLVNELMDTLDMSFNEIQNLILDGKMEEVFRLYDEKMEGR